MVNMQWHTDLLNLPGLAEILSRMPESLIPGPSYVRPETKLALLGPNFDNRGEVVEELFAASLKNLKVIAGVNDDYEVLLLPSASGTDGLEATVRSLIGPDELVLAVSVGPFGDLYFNVAERNGKKAELLRFPDGQTIDLNVLEEKMQTYKPAVVLVTHNETATGVTNKIEDVCEIVHKYGARLFADGVSIFGSRTIRAPVDAYVGATHKALAMSAGLTPVIVTKEELKRSAGVPDRGRSHDLLQHLRVNKDSQPLKSPPVPVVWQLYYQTNYIVNKGGMELREASHNALRAATHNWLQRLPGNFELFPQSKDITSITVTCLRVPEHLDRMALEKAMLEEGYSLGRGYRGLPPTVRIAHMGDVTLSMLHSFMPKLIEHMFALGRP